MDQRESLNKCLEKVARFSSEELELIWAQCSYRKIAKNEFLLKAGQIANQVFFILKGACYQYRLDDFEEHIIELHIASDCVINHFSFVGQKPALENIKAYTDLEVLTLDIYAIHHLISLSPAFFQLGKILEVTNSRTDFFDSAMTPVEKHQYLLSHRPLLFQNFPLKYIASYLKITPETLSRVRAIP